jgi:tetratricopeptide (TPR) repeat protein
MALKGLGRFDAAENSIRRALALFEQCGADEWQIASALDNLGTTLSAAGRLQEAMAALEEARGILERHLEPDHLEVAWTWNHLGDVRYRLGDLDGARVAYEQAVSIRAAALPPDHPDLVESRQRQDHVLRTLARMEQADSPAGNGHG